jgi:hypothetical protein
MHTYIYIHYQKINSDTNRFNSRRIRNSPCKSQLQKPQQVTIIDELTDCRSLPFLFFSLPRENQHDFKDVGHSIEPNFELNHLFVRIIHEHLI